MKRTDFSYPFKMGLYCFMVHFWFFYFLFRVTSDSVQWTKIAQVLLVIFDLPAVILSFFGFIHMALIFSDGKHLWAEIYVLTIGSLMYFGLGYLAGLDRLDFKKKREKKDSEEES